MKATKPEIKPHLGLPSNRTRTFGAGVDITDINGEELNKKIVDDYIDNLKELVLKKIQEFGSLDKVGLYLNLSIKPLEEKKENGNG